MGDSGIADYLIFSGHKFKERSVVLLSNESQFYKYRVLKDIEIALRRGWCFVTDLTGIIDEESFTETV